MPIIKCLDGITYVAGLEGTSLSVVPCQGILGPLVTIKFIGGSERYSIDKIFKVHQVDYQLLDLWCSSRQACKWCYSESECVALGQREIWVYEAGI